MENQKPYLSVVVPLYNEEGNVKELHKQILLACQGLGKSFEIIFVDDGSKDNTVKDCEGLTPLTLIKFRKNFGQTAAFDAGIKQAKGEVVITMDGDLQNDPQDMGLSPAERSVHSNAKKPISYQLTATHDCAGPAYFTNPVTGQNSANETVSYWQFGIADGNYTDGTHQYSGVDYTSGP